jgi:hypothetical protein
MSDPIAGEGNPLPDRGPEGPAIIIGEDEDSENLYAVGHVDAEAFLRAADEWIQENYDWTNFPPILPSEAGNPVIHSWFRIDDDAEHFELCDPSELGAEPYTHVELSQ